MAKFYLTPTELAQKRGRTKVVAGGLALFINILMLAAFCLVTYRLFPVEWDNRLMLIGMALVAISSALLTTTKSLIMISDGFRDIRA